jgi:hypothetical protein
LSDAAKLADQSLGDRLGVNPLDRQGEQILDQLMIEQSLAAALEQASAEAGAMAS